MQPLSFNVTYLLKALCPKSKVLTVAYQLTTRKVSHYEGYAAIATKRAANLYNLQVSATRIFRMLENLHDLFY